LAEGEWAQMVPATSRRCLFRRRLHDAPALLLRGPRGTRGASRCRGALFLPYMALRGDRAAAAASSAAIHVYLPAYLAGGPGERWRRIAQSASEYYRDDSAPLSRGWLIIRSGVLQRVEADREVAVGAL